MKDKLILAIDTSCDETSVAILNGRKVLSSVRATQEDLHRKWGGIVPDIARRAHIENIPGTYKEAMKRASVEINDIDYIAVTYGPGLAIDLEVGLEFGKELAIKNSIPFIPVNHMEGHLLSSLSLNSKGNGKISDKELNELFPALGLLISGKHTEIIYVEDIGKYRKIGYTLDDAAGEAFDKVGRMLNFGYPGGPVVSEFAKKGDTGVIPLPIPMEKSEDYNFSYSGLKTACLYRLKELREGSKKESEWSSDFCRSFVESVIRSIEIKLKRAINDHPEVRAVLTGGGVLQCEALARRIGSLVRKEGLRYLLPKMEYRTDNAAMIGLAAFFSINRKDAVLKTSKEAMKVDRVPRLSL